MSALDRFFTFTSLFSPSDRLLYFSLTIIFLVAGTTVLYSVNSALLEEVPHEGGVFTEGIVGTPRFINPALSITRADMDLVSLVYAGLVRSDSTSTLVPYLADSVTISDDGTVYNVTLRDNIFFHDGTPITAQDVAFTISLVQNPELKSPHRNNWFGVTVETLSDRELNFVLEEPYQPFIENLTLGIMPKHIWEGLTIEQLPFSQHNAEPIGSGVYRVQKVVRDESGLIEQYTLTPSPYAIQSPKLKEIHFSFFQNETMLQEGLKNEEILATSYLSPESVSSVEGPYTIQELDLPRIHGLFFNQNRSAILRDGAVRSALDVLIDREVLIEQAEFGFAVPTQGPIPPAYFELESLEATSTEHLTEFATSTDPRLEHATAILNDGGWERNEEGVWEKEIDEVPTTLELELKTFAEPAYERTVTYLTGRFGQLGIPLKTSLYTQNDLTQNVIRTREYQILLTGIDVGRSLDLYPFWHSSQREDPGSNIALYTNIEADTYLRTARESTTREERDEALRNFYEEIREELPAVFLFSPTLPYLVHNGVMISIPKQMSAADERFDQVTDWYMEVSRVWPIFNTERNSD